MLTDARHAARPFAGLDRQQAIILAVSGGSDSTALLVLARAHFSQRNPACRLVAVTVDHGLRPESAAEAEAVGALCATLGVPHRTVRWDGPKPATGIAAAARAVRYRLLADAACREGARVVLSGHTADDQAETVAMRRSRGDGRGLAGMATAVLVDGDVWVMRPLLGLRRQALRDRLGRDGFGWIDDPSNADRRSERVRVRGALAEDEVPALLQLAAERAAERRRLSIAVGGLIAAHARQPAPGLFSLDLAGLGPDGPAVTGEALRLMLATAGGTPYLPPQDKVQALADTLTRASQPRATLGRCLIATRRGRLWIARESRGLPPPGSWLAGGTWDGRFRVARPQDGPAGFAADPDGGESAQAEDAPAALIRAARQARPDAGGMSGGPWQPIVAPYARFLPAFDLPAAAAMARLVGAPAFPQPPWAGHNGTEA